MSSKTIIYEELAYIAESILDDFYVEWETYTDDEIDDLFIEI